MSNAARVDADLQATAARVFGVAATHMHKRSAEGRLAGPLCGQRATDGTSFARTHYSTDAARVTCKKCLRALAKVSSA